MIHADPASSLFAPWAADSCKRAQKRPCVSSILSDLWSSKRKIFQNPKYDLSQTGESSCLSMHGGNDGDSLKEIIHGIKSKERPVKTLHIKQEKGLDNVGINMKEIEHSLSQKSVIEGQIKSVEFPLVTTIPVGGQEFIASVLATSSEDNVCPVEVSSMEEKMRVDSEAESDANNIDKVIQLSGDHTYFEFKSPRKKVILKITKNPEKPVEKVKSLEELVNILNRDNLLSSDARCMVEAFVDLPEGLARCRSQNRSTTRPKMKYSTGVLKFASTLYFHSPRSYEYVSQVFILPDPSVLRTSIRVKDYFPGFTNEVLLMLKDGFSKVPYTDKICSIMIVNSQLREQCNFNVKSGKVFGYVDYGCGLTCEDSDCIPLATNALLFIAVGLNAPWKVPFGYFLNNGLSGEFLKSLVYEAIIALEESDLEVRNVICDGQGTFLSLGKLLGCKIDVKSFKDMDTSFPHPSTSDRKLHLMFNASLGLSLLKYLLADKETLMSSTYGEIKWKYLKMLLEPSCSDLWPDSEFYRNKMKIALGSHSLGNSLGKVLELLGQPESGDFADCASTENFAADIDRAFDTLNSRNPVMPGEKSPVYQYTVEEQKESLTFVARRIMGLELPSGKRALDEGRRMSVISFPFTLKAVAQLATELVSRNIVKYLCTYRLSLDHAEVVLRSLQLIGGWQTNPTANQFRAAYKELLVKANAVFQVNSLYTDDFEGKDITVGQGIIYPARAYFEDQVPDIDEFKTCKSCLLDYESEMKYRARFVSFLVAQKLSCSDCIEILLDDGSRSVFMNSQTEKIYVNPSSFVCKLIKLTEKHLRIHLSQPHQGQIEMIISDIFNKYSSFNQSLGVKEESLEHYAEEPHHVICLCKVIIRTFVHLMMKNHIAFKKNL